MFDITWSGDILLADQALPYLVKHGHDWPFELLRPLLSADYAVGNAEGPITTRTETHWPDRPYNYNAAPEAAAALARAGFRAMSLCNNHCFDRGPQGLVDSAAHLRAAGIGPFGAGQDQAEAEAPLLIDTPHGTVGVVGLGQRFRHGSTATPTTPGTIALSRAAIRRGRELAIGLGARWVVAFVHWGGVYRPVTDLQRRRASQFAQEGYDLVIGHGPHIVQLVEILDGMPVLYSLGNCAFGSFGRFHLFEVPGRGLIARTRFDEGGVAAIELTPISTDNLVVEFQPRRCEPAAAEQVHAALGPDIVGNGLISVVR